jgi:hypothetical protein
MLCIALCLQIAKHKLVVFTFNLKVCHATSITIPKYLIVE